MRILAALGGNALARRGQPITAQVQRENAAIAAGALVPLIGEHQLVVTHGNGPQVGMLLLESETDVASGPYPLDVIGAESEGMVGYLLEQALLCERPDLTVATLLTQTVVDACDPAFTTPSKPVGPLYDEETARRLARERGFSIAPDTGGWRRVVPSPEPRAILEARPIALLVDGGVTVIAGGGGGVPVVLDDAGRPHGVEGVVDKDRAAMLLALELGADVLLLLTDVDAVYRGFGTPDAEAVRSLTPHAAAQLVDSGEASAGSMAPKLEAAAHFARHGGTAIVSSLEQAGAALSGAAGTRVASTAGVRSTTAHPPLRDDLAAQTPTAPPMRRPTA